MIPTLSAADRLRALAAEQLERDGWSREQVLEYQRGRLDELLAHAREHSPYYGETLDPGTDLADLPTLSKATLMEHWDRIVCDPRLTRAAVEAHAAGPTAGEPLHGEFEIFSTSGASGLRGLFAYSARDWATAIAATLRATARSGMRPEMRTIGIGAPGGVHMSKRIYAALQSGRSDTPTLSALTPLDEMVTTLNAYRPGVLLGYSSIGALLAAEQLAGRLSIAPRLIAFGSEPLTAEMRDRIRAAWGLDPGEYYASTEVPVIASSTPAHPRALEVFEDLEIVEVGRRGRPPGAARHARRQGAAHEPGEPHAAADPLRAGRPRDRVAGAQSGGPAVEAPAGDRRP